MSTLSDAKSRWGRKAGAKLVTRSFSSGARGGKRPAKKSEYGQQLMEKQKAKKTYGLRERQFRLLFARAGRKGDAGEHLLKLLESRLDNVIYRLGLAISRAQARQMVNHCMFTVNGKKVNIPSYQVKGGDIIAIKKNKRQLKLFANLADKQKKIELPGWLFFNPNELEGKVLHAPTNDDVDKSLNAQAIVEFYSK